MSPQHGIESSSRMSGEMIEMIARWMAFGGESEESEQSSEMSVAAPLVIWSERERTLAIAEGLPREREMRESREKKSSANKVRKPPCHPPLAPSAGHGPLLTSPLLLLLLLAHSPQQAPVLPCRCQVSHAPSKD
jgi:hypothetical protein